MSPGGFVVEPVALRVLLNAAPSVLFDGDPDTSLERVLATAVKVTGARAAAVASSSYCEAVGGVTASERLASVAREAAGLEWSPAGGRGARHAVVARLPGGDGVLAVQPPAAQQLDAGQLEALSILAGWAALVLQREPALSR